MKNRILIVLALISFGSYGQINVKVSGNIFNTGTDSIFISQYYGSYYNDFVGEVLSADGTFSIDAQLDNADYYVLRFGQKHVNIILRDSSDIKVYADGTKTDKHVNYIGSDESDAMTGYLMLISAWQIKVDSANAVLKNDPSQRPTLNQEMGQAQKVFQSKQQAFLGKNKNSAALYPALSMVDVKNDFNSYESLVKQLYTAFPESPTIRDIHKKYEELIAERLANDPLAPGKPAPDFEEKMTDGTTTMKLSDLKGKVVLIDFWASWCGPCRRENPNVVKAYNKYKDDGFTVMSVSLDKSKAKWLAAIEADGLIWPNHVSDLKQWSSEVARIYGVRSIPFTLLIDAEGNIVKANLRGPALEAELARIFGE